MSSTKSAILLIFLSLQSFFLFSQDEDFFSDSIRAKDLNTKAYNLRSNGLHLQALDTFFYGLELRKNRYGEESYNLAAVHMGIGRTYRSLGQYDLALKYFNLAENIYIKSGRFSLRNKSGLYLNIGNVYRSKLDFKRALEYFNQTLSIYQNNNEFDIEYIANINYSIAEIFYLINDFASAIKLINQNIKNANTPDKILYYELLAFVNQLKGNNVEAKNNYLNAINLARKEYKDFPIDIAIEYLNYALFLISAEEFIEANYTLNKAFEIIKLSQPERGTELEYYYNINGELARNISIETRDIISFSEQKKEKLNQALNWYLKGLQALNFPTSYSLETINESANWLSMMNCITLLKKIADTHKEIADIENSDKKIESLKSAIENYQIASSLIQKARKEISSDESKIQLTELEHSTFQKLIKTAFEAYSLTNNNEYLELAFQSTERTKSASVFDQLSDQSALQNSLIPDSLIQLEQKLNNTISIYSEKLYEENSEEKPDSILITDYNTRIFEANKNREELNQFLEVEYSDYYDLKYSKSMLSIFDIQQKLSEEEVVLEYVLNETDSASELYTFIISNNEVQFNQQIVNNKFLESIESMFNFMSDPEYMFTTNKESITYCESAHHLFNILIKPFYRNIQNKQLTIVPDGKLSYIAFDGLLEELPDTSQAIKFDQLKYLIKNFSINYSNSSNLLFKLQSPSKNLKNKVIAFAPEYNSDSIEIANQYYILFPLPGVQKEVDIISETVNTDVFKGDNASETNFRKNIEKYDILHLAMHAFINDSLPAFSKLAFTQNNTTKNLLSDGSINTADIYNLNLNARLAVLSACNTGSGKLRKGEGIMSLARGFFYAGCPSIVMSLWEVEDQSGTEIMGVFYKNLKKGKTKNEALRQAKLEYLENSNSRRAHPHYWLSYINLGNNSPLYKSYDFYFFIILILLLVAVLTDQLYKIKKARKKRAL
ncbi:MAG: CHAT domain-containing protein [Bacteroidetes bacterium]|nr:CHAT domain-containing protein [Bacteroidota bacterium]